MSVNSVYFNLDDFSSLEALSTMHTIIIWTAFVISALFQKYFAEQTWIRITIGFLLGYVFCHWLAGHSAADLIPPDTCMVLYFPMFVLKLMYTMDSYILMKSLIQILLFSITTLLIVIVVMGFSIAYVQTYEISLTSMVLVGVCFVIYDIPQLRGLLDAVRNLQTICYGEVILNAAVVTIIVEILRGIYGGFVNTWYHVCIIFIRYLTFSIIMGLICGNLLLLFYRRLIDDSTSSVITSISSSYIIYIICEHLVFCNGILAVAISIYCTSKERPRLPVEVDNEIKVFINHFHEVFHGLFVIYIMIHKSNRLLDTISSTNVLIALCAYVISRVLKLFQIMMLAPVISRLGYGFDFTSSMAMLSCSRNAVGSMIVHIVLKQDKLLSYYNLHIGAIVVIVAFLSYTLNGCIANQMLMKYKLLDLSSSRKINISAGMSIVIDKQVKMISVLKMNRFFSDANWPLINECTKLVNPFNIQTGNDGQSFGIRQMTCTNCLKKIFVEPTKRELGEISKDAHYRVLKAIKLALINQYEHGMLGVKEIKLLSISVESALDTEELFIKLDELYKLFEIPVITEKIKLIMLKVQVSDILKKPANPFRAFCYILHTSLWFKLFFDCIILFQIAVVIYCVIVNSAVEGWLTIIINGCIDFLCLLEIYIKLNAYSATTFKRGCIKFVRNRWNKIDIATLALCLLDTFLAILSKIIYMPNNLLVVLKIFRLTRLVRVVKLLNLFGNVYPKFVDFCDKIIEEKISYAFTLGVAIIMAYENVIEQLIYMVESPLIRENIKIRLENDKMAVVEYIGSLVRKRPWVAIKVETKQAVLGVFKQMHLGIEELKTTGHVDDFEYEKLKALLERHYKNLTISKYDQFISPKEVFSEITYLSDDEETINFLYEHVTTKIWNAGDVVCEPGTTIEGIHILIAGMFKVMYTPNKQALQRLAREGLLPIKDFLVNARFTEEQTEYVMVGNTVGELCILTGRGYSCQIVSYTSSQAFIISKERVWDAIENSSDPVNGLAPKMWKYISQQLAKRILWNTPVYHSMSEDNLNYILDRAVMPELGAFKSISVCELIEDMVLIEGIVVDSNTRCVYRAPCYIPRTVQSILLPKYSGLNFTSVIQSRLIIIPMVDADEYELMLRLEGSSEMVPHAPSRLLLSKRKIKQRRKRKQNLMTRGRSSMSTTTLKRSQSNISVVGAT